MFLNGTTRDRAQQSKVEQQRRFKYAKRCASLLTFLSKTADVDSAGQLTFG